MEYEILITLIIICICLGLLGIVYLIKYLLPTNIITENRNKSIDILKVSKNLIKTLKFKNLDDNTIILLVTIAIEGLEKAIIILRTNSIEDYILFVEDFIFSKCIRLNIDINNEIKIAIRKIIEHLIKNEYGKRLELY